MDREIWKAVMDSVRRACKRVGPGKGPGRRVSFPHRLIVAMYLWAAWHDRCLSWACDRAHYGTLFRPRRKLPSVSQFTRRVNGDACRRVLQLVHDDLAARGVAFGPLGYLDGKPLTVGPAGKDPDAARGHVTGGFAKGYKLHAYVNENRRVVVWSVMPLNVDEKVVAAEMLPHLRRALPPAACGPDALTLADSNYDSAPLYKAAARQAGGGGAPPPLFAPLKGQRRVGPQGHHPVTLRQMGPERREAVAAWHDHPGVAGYVMKWRNNIEGVFSVLTCTGNLGHLPTFVRRLARVRRWAGAKIILYHARLLAQEAAAA
jgi:hypothetical protein